MIDATEVRRRLHYDPATGHFTYLRRDEDSGDARRWNARMAGKRAGSLNHHGYVVIKLYKAHYQAHRLAWIFVTGRWPDDEIDHINRQRADNRWENLRAATSQENKRNRSQTTSTESGIVGVSRWARNGRWRAYITVDGRQTHLGTFGSKSEALAAREAAAQRLFVIGDAA